MKNDGGPAYPIVCDGDPVQILHSGGMSMRDAFAIGALTGLASATTPDGTWAYGDRAGLAAESFALADAMIKEREK
jgi:hypothetical protein